jgi:ribonuclease-3
VRTKTFTREDELISRFQSLNSEHDIVANDIGLFILAFVHRSIVNERPDKAPEHNERLEFLGDAVLELVITEQLFQDFPEKPE